MKSPSMIELYLISLPDVGGVLEVSVIDQEEGRLKENQRECDGLAIS